MSSLRPVHGPTGELVPALRAWLDAADPAPLIVETSGSTGRPKRVLLSQSAVLASIRASAARLGAQGAWVLDLPASYVAGLQVICRSLVAGHAPVIAGEHGGLAAAIRALPAEVPGFSSLVPTQLHRILTDPAATAERAALAGLHTVLLGGGPIDPALRALAEAAGIHVVATYGASETAGGCVYDGVPLDGVAVALGADGRIRLSGPVLADGYDGDPDLTARTFVDGWYLTADAGSVDADGRLQVLGRLDDILITGGVKVPAPAVARRLREHPALADAEVVGVDDPEWGQRLVAVVVGTEPAPSLSDLRDWVAQAHPRTWAPRELCTVEALPRTERGKVDRAALARLAGGGR